MKIIKFEATWCAPCKRQNEEFEDHPLKVPVESIDIDDCDKELLMLHHVSSVPKMVLFDDNDEVLNEWTGLTRSSEINDFIDGRQTTAD